MPHAYVEIVCSCCNKNKKYHCFSHDEDEKLNDFDCHHVKCTVDKKTRFGWLLGFDQLAGLYFNIRCLICGKKEQYSYEAKTFGKEKEEHNFLCCQNNLSFHCSWAH